MLSFYANENSGYVYESALFWWLDDLRQASLNWMLLKGGLIASLGVAVHTISKVDLRLRSCGAVFNVLQAILRAVAVAILALNLYMGFNGGNWATLWLNHVHDPTTTAKRRGSELDMSEHAEARREWEAQAYEAHISHWTHQNGEKYAFLDLAAFLLIIVTQQKKVMANSRVLGCLVFLHLVVNLDKFIVEVWKLTNDNLFYQTVRHNELWSLKMLSHLNFEARWKVLAFLHENVISIDVLFFLWHLRSAKCSRADCHNVCGYECPSCVNLGLTEGGFCSEDCLKAVWETHKLCHTERNEGSFSYTGSLRPHAYSSAELRPVPEGIAAPEWATTGAPALVVNVTAQASIPIALTIDVQKVKVASKICRDALDAGHRAIKAGVTTEEIDRVVHEYIVARGAYPALLNHHKFPGSCTTSINEAIAQGVPDQRPLEDGDMITLGVGCYKDGYFSDIAETYCVGVVDEQGRKLAETAH